MPASSLRGTPDRLIRVAENRPHDQPDGDPTMTEQAGFADIVLGFEGLAILRAWMLDNDTVNARTREILDIAAQIEEEPWSNPLIYSEDTVTAGYAEWAATYDNPGNPILLAEEPVVHEILARYPIGAALDAACGTGRHTEYLASLGHEVTGIDSTPEMLELAAAKVPEAKFQTADITAIPFDDGHFDLAVCALALTHSPNVSGPISELTRVLRPGGRLVISDVHPFDVVLSVQGGFRRKSGGRGFVRNYVHLTSDYLNAFQQAGLTVVRCIEPLWGDREIATIGFSEQMPDLLDTAVKGLPIAIVWELQKNA